MRELPTSKPESIPELLARWTRAAQEFRQFNRQWGTTPQLFYAETLEACVKELTGITADETSAVNQRALLYLCSMCEAAMRAGGMDPDVECLNCENQRLQDDLTKALANHSADLTAVPTEGSQT